MTGCVALEEWLVSKIAAVIVYKKLIVFNK